MEGKWKDLIRKVGMGRFLVMAAAGIFLLVISLSDFFQAFSGKEEKEAVQEQENNTSADETEEYVSRMEEKVEEFLSDMAFAGEVRVMITLKSSKESVTQKDIPYTKENSTETGNGSKTSEDIRITMEEQTVYTETEAGRQIPYVTKELEPEVEGVVVLAEGAGRENVKTEIIEAIEVLFGIPVHKIKVMKLET